MVMRVRGHAAWGVLLLCAQALAGGHADGIRIGLTPVVPDGQIDLLEEVRDYLAAGLGEPVTFVQRRSYREVMDELLSGRIDYAWICGLPYIDHEEALELIGVPVYQGRPHYRSYLIVPAIDQTTESIHDLEGRVFAFSDPDSNSGYLVPMTQLLAAGRQPDRFFSQTFFTWTHADVIAAVAARLADGGAVDGYVWDYLSQVRPELTARTRVVWRSEPYGFPPVVARRSSVTQGGGLRDRLLEMGDDAYGSQLLQRLRLDGFVAGDPALYESIREQRALLQGERPVP